MLVEPGSLLYSIALFAHIVFFAYWIGADLGVYYASRFVLKPEISDESRVTASAIEHFLDTTVRISLIMILPSGVTLLLAHGFMGLTASVPAIALVWGLSAGWLVLMLLERRTQDPEQSRKMKLADGAIRVVVFLALLVFSVWFIVTAFVDGSWGGIWIFLKIGLYALTVGCGLAIRVRSKSFLETWTSIQREGSTEELEKRLRSQMAGTIPYVHAIWVFVFLAAFIGVTKPWIG